MSKIKSTELTKFQRLNYVQIAPSGSLVALAGRNKQGKSSYLDGLEAAICGHNGRVITRPINDGADKAGITVETDDGLVINRTYTAAGSKLTIKAADGAKYGQAKLDSLLGELGIDSSRFASLTDKDQLKTLLGLVDLPFDPARLDAERSELFVSRTDANRKVKELQAQVAALDPSPAGLPNEEVSVSALVSEFRKNEMLNREILAARQAVVDAAANVDRLAAELAEAEVSHAKALARATSAPPLADLATMQARLDGAEATNAQIRAAKDRQAAETRLTIAQQEASALTDAIEEIDMQKADGLAAAKFPVDGLSFDTEGVLYRGRPFSRASSAEKVLVSAAMMIALNPELRVLIVRNGNDLDSESLAELEAMAADADFQIFIEIVNESGDFGITIEDGEVVA